MQLASAAAFSVIFERNARLLTGRIAGQRGNGLEPLVKLIMLLETDCWKPQQEINDKKLPLQLGLSRSPYTVVIDR